MSGRISLGALALFASGCLTYGREQATETIAEPGPISRVEIDLDAGEVNITSARSTEGARGGVDSRWSDAAPEVLHYVSEGVLHVIARCDAFAVACRSDVTLEVASNVSVGVQTGEGAVRVSGIAGDVEVGTDDGDIELHDIHGVVFVESGNGSITADGLAGTMVDARTKGGTVEMEVTTYPDRVVARTENGDVNLLVPEGPYRVQADAPSGDLVLGEKIRDDATAPAVIVAETKNGDVRIEGAPGGAGAGTPQAPQRSEPAPRRADQTPASTEGAPTRSQRGR